MSAQWEVLRQWQGGRPEVFSTHRTRRRAERVARYRTSLGSFNYSVREEGSDDEHREAAGDRDDSVADYATGGAIQSGVSIYNPITFTGSTTSRLTFFPNATPDESIRESTAEVPILAYKVARLIWKPNRGPSFAALNQSTFYGSQISYEADADAVCASTAIYGAASLGSFYSSPQLPHGDCPSLHCSCGFYACTDLSMLDGGAVVLEVELSGKVIVCERGYRAGHQRVIRAHLRGCHYCGTTPSVASFEPESELRLRCAQHADATPSVPIEQLTTLLGVPVDVDSSVRSEVS